MNEQRVQHVPMQLGRYEVIEQIGRGGMGIVFRAHETALERSVALKVLAPELAGQSHSLARLRREAVSAARLRHPNIALLYELGQERDLAFLVMEYVPGMSLDRLLKTVSLSAPQALDIISQIGDALEYAHRMGIIHRDVKPSNILVTPDQHAVLIDFGLAGIHAQTTLTADGAVLGTPHYMAPEQAAGRSATVASDQYALAAVAYELLTGRSPFQGRAPTAILYAHIHDTPDLPSEVNPSLPVAVNAVLMRALAKSPEGRYPSLPAFVEGLRIALLPPLVPHLPVWRRKWALAACAVALALAAVIGARLLPDGRANALGLVNVGRVSQGGQPIPKNVAWSRSITLRGGPPLVAARGVLVAGTLDGTLLALQAGNGELLWQRGDGATRYGPAATNGSAIFVGMTGTVLALTPERGGQIWERTVAGAVLVPPVVDYDALVVVTDKGNLYLLQTESGLVLWQRPLVSGVQTLAVGAGRIFATAGRSLFALDRSNGAVDWQFSAPDMITTPPAMFGDMVFVGTSRGELLAFAVADGVPARRYQARGPLSAAPVAGPNALYVADQSGEVVALNPRDATVIWRADVAAAVVGAPLVVGDSLLFGAANGMFYALRSTDGREIARIQLAGSVVESAASDADLIFVRADKLYALGT